MAAAVVAGKRSRPLQRHGQQQREAGSDGSEPAYFVAWLLEVCLCNRRALRQGPWCVFWRLSLFSRLHLAEPTRQHGADIVGSRPLTPTLAQRHPTGFECASVADHHRLAPFPNNLATLWTPKAKQILGQLLRAFHFNYIQNPLRQTVLRFAKCNSACNAQARAPRRRRTEDVRLRAARHRPRAAAV